MSENTENNAITVIDDSSVPNTFGISSTLELNLVSGSVKAGMREIGSESGLFMADPTKLRVIKGFNTRVKDQVYWEGIKKLALSIKENGFYKDKPLACVVANEDGKNVIYVVEGGRRLDAVILRMAWMTEDERKAFRVPTVAKDRETSEVDLVYGMAKGNTAEPFRPYELAVLVKRLKQVYMQTDEQILNRFSGDISASYLANLLIVAGAPRQIAKLVLEDKLSVTQAAQAMNQYGNRAIEVLLQAKANSEKHGNGKITDRFMPGKRLQNAVKKESMEIYSSMKMVTSDPGYASLSEETRAVLRDLLNELKQFEDVGIDGTAERIVEAAGQLVDSSAQAA